MHWWRAHLPMRILLRQRHAALLNSPFILNRLLLASQVIMRSFWHLPFPRLAEASLEFLITVAKMPLLTIFTFASRAG